MDTQEQTNWRLVIDETVGIALIDDLGEHAGYSLAQACAIMPGLAGDMIAAYRALADRYAADLNPDERDGDERYLTVLAELAEVGKGGLTVEQLAVELATAQLAGQYACQVTIWRDEQGWSWEYGALPGGLHTTLTWDVGDEEGWVGSEEEALTAAIAQDLDTTFEDRLERQER